MSRRPQNQNVAYPMTGLDESTDPMVAKGLLRLENAVVTRAGMIDKREGVTELTTVGTGLDQLGVYKDRPVIIGKDIQIKNGSAVDVGTFDSPSQQALGFLDIDPQPLSSTPGYRIVAPDVAEAGSVRAYAWVDLDADGNWDTVVKTFDVNSGIVLDEDRPVASHPGGDTNARVLLSNSKLYVFMFDGTTLKYLTINTSTGVIGSLSTLTSAPAGSSNYLYLDAVSFGSSDQRALIVYADTNDDMCALVFNTSTDAYVGDHTVTATIQNAPGCYKLSDTTAVALWYDAAGGSRIVAAVGVDTSASVSVTQVTLETLSGTDQVDSLIGIRTSDTTSIVMIGHREDSSAYPIIKKALFNDVSGTGSSPGADSYQRDMLIASKLFQTDTRYYFLACFYGHETESPQATLFAIDAVNPLSTAGGIIGGKVLVGRAGLAASADAGNNGPVPTVIEPSTGTFRCVGIERLRMGFGNTDETLGLVSLTIEDADRMQSGEGQGSLFTATAGPSEYDGNIAHEQGFPSYPEGVTGVASTGTGSLTASSTYGYHVTYEWFDAQGARHESAPSPAISPATGVSDDTITLTIPCLHLSAKRNVMIVIWRTEADGSVYYRAGSTPNDTTADSVSYADEAADSAINENEQLYTQSGQLENVQPPPYRAMVVWQNRLFYVDHERRASRVQYTKEFVRGSGVSHSDLLTIECSERGGNIIALAVMDEKLLIFKERAIFATQGRAADDTGQGGSFADPWMVSPIVGCLERNSVVLTPIGLFFEGQDGIYLLGRDLQLKPLGEAVRYQTEDSGFVAIGAVCVPEDNHVIFIDTTANALVYNYQHNIWSVWTNPAGKSIVYAAGTFYYAYTGGISAQYRTFYQDDGSDYALTIETPWFAFGGPGAKQWWRQTELIGYARAAHTLRVKTAYDYVDTWTDSKTYDVTAAAKLNAQYIGHSDHYDMSSAGTMAAILRHRGSRQRCMAFRHHFSDESSSGAGFSLAALNIRVGVLPDHYDLGSARSVS